MKKKIIAAAAALVLILCLIFIIGGQTDNEAEYIQIQTRDYEEKVVESGQLKLARETTLIAGVSATVKELVIAEGDIVSAGSILIKLDDSDQVFQVEQKRASYLDANARYNQIVNYEYNAAKEELNRLTSVKEQALDFYQDAQVLFNEGALSQNDLSQAKTAYDTAAAQWNTANLKVAALANGGAQRVSAYEQLQSAKAIYNSAIKEASDYLVSVPWDSVLLKAYVQSADHVQPGDPLADIGEAGSYFVTVEIDEKYFPYVKKGKTKALIFIGDDKANGMEGFVTGVTPKINKDTGTFELKISVPYEFPYQASDLTVNTEIILKQMEDAIAIPSVYLTENSSENKTAEDAAVYVFINGKVQLQEIKIQRGPSSLVLVTKGLADGDIIVKPFSGIKDGDAVKLSGKPVS